MNQPNESIVIREWLDSASSGGWGLTFDQLLVLSRVPGYDTDDIVYVNENGVEMTRHMCNTLCERWLTFHSAFTAGWKACLSGSNTTEMTDVSAQPITNDSHIGLSTVRELPRYTHTTFCGALPDSEGHWIKYSDLTEWLDLFLKANKMGRNPI